MRRVDALITDELREFLGVIDTAFLATASADGQPYVQHRGGPKGFIRALDDHTLGFLDLAGNRQYLTVGNLAENPRVCLFLIDYERRRRVKVWGTARVAPLDAELVAHLAIPGAGVNPAPSISGPGRVRPERAFLIDVERWDVNCPAHIPRKVDAAEVAAAIARYEARIAELEAALAASGAVT